LATTSLGTDSTRMSPLPEFTRSESEKSPSVMSPLPELTTLVPNRPVATTSAEPVFTDSRASCGVVTAMASFGERPRR
jgi:hypothetical protein